MSQRLALLLTDVVDSTQLAERLGDAAAAEAAFAAREDAYSRLNMAPMVSLIDAFNAFCC